MTGDGNEVVGETETTNDAAARNGAMMSASSKVDSEECTEDELCEYFCEKV